MIMVVGMQKELKLLRTLLKKLGLENLPAIVPNQKTTNKLKTAALGLNDC